MPRICATRRISRERFQLVWSWWTADRCWYLVVAGLVFVRLVLTAKDEVWVTKNDAINYARLASYYLSGEPQDVLPSQRPGIGLLAQLSTSVGVPYKLFLEGLCLAIVYLAAFQTRRWTGSTAVGLITFAMLFLHPWSLGETQNFVSEPVTALLLVLLVIGSAPYFRRPVDQWTVRQSCLAVLAGVTLVLVRPEDPIVYAFTLLIALMTLGCALPRFRKLTPWRRWICLGIVLLPAVASYVTTETWKRLHAVHFGVSALTMTDAPGMRALLNALYAVRPNQAIRFAPVTRQSLQAACAQSPTLADYQAQLLDETGVNYGRARDNLGLAGEVGTWLNWHLVGAFGGIHPKSNAAMTQAAAEIWQAIDDGRLPRRTARYPIDPLWQAWSRELGSCFGKALWTSFSPRLAVGRKRLAQQQSQVNVVDAGYFDHGLLRRRGTRPTAELRVYGRTADDSQQFSRVRVTGPNRELLGISRISISPSGGLQFNLATEAFRLSDRVRPQNQITLQFLGESQASEGFSTDISLDGRWSQFRAGPEPNARQVGSTAQAWRVLASLTTSHDVWRTQVQLVIAKYFLPALGVAAIVSLACGAYRRPVRRPNVLLGLLVAGWGLLLGRSMFYTLVEVWLHWGIERYVGPQSMLTVWLLILTTFFLGNQLRRVSRMKSFRSPTVDAVAHES